jgi:hypothetical protein
VPFRGWRRAAAILLIVTGWTACSRGSTSPSPLPQVPQTPVPQPVQNAWPVISAVTASVARAEVNQDVDIVADVSDAETPSGALDFRWTASAGDITGSGPRVTWRLAAGATTPQDVTITLEVVEHFADYTLAGAPTTSEHRVSRSAAPIRVHDSPAEIGKMALAFLVDYFGHSEVSPSACLVDFSDSCRGKAEELSDIEANRRTFVILDASARVDRISVDAGMTYADVIAPCTFRDRRLGTGYEGTTDGDCLLSAVYEDRRWWLCDSHFRSH